LARHTFYFLFAAGSGAAGIGGGQSKYSSSHLISPRSLPATPRVSPRLLASTIKVLLETTKTIADALEFTASRQRTHPDLSLANTCWAYSLNLVKFLTS